MQHEVSGPAAIEVQDSDQGPGASGRESNGSTKPTGDGRVAYRWQTRDRWNSLELRYENERMPLVSGSHEEFIAEHYFGYCGQRGGGTLEYQVEHPPWRIWQASAARLDADVGLLYGPQFVPVLSRPPTSVFLADGSVVAVMRPQRIA